MFASKGLLIAIVILSYFFSYEIRINLAESLLNPYRNSRKRYEIEEENNLC
jgi:hypothetical protein